MSALRRRLRRPGGSTLLGRAWRTTRTKIGLFLVVLVVTIALLGPLFAGPTTDFVGAPFDPPNSEALFGTDVLGRDVWARYLSGGRSTLTTALLATVLGVGIGALLGLVAALSRSWVGDLLGRAMDLALVFPIYVLVLVVIAVLGGRSVFAVIAIAYIPIVGRVIRAAALEVARRDHVQYARLLGESRWTILRHDLLPNVSGALSVEAGLRLTYAIAMASALSYLGFGPAPPTPDWGSMISENQVGIQIQPWGVLLPVATIAVLTIGTNLIAEGLAAASSQRSGASDDDTTDPVATIESHQAFSAPAPTMPHRGVEDS